MSYSQEMIGTNPSPAIGGDALAACIEARFARARS